MLNLLLMEWVTKMKTGSNSVEDHPKLSHNRHPVDGALVHASSLWPLKGMLDVNILSNYFLSSYYYFRFVCSCT
jgi:hypothetical protein